MGDARGRLAGCLTIRERVIEADREVRPRLLPGRDRSEYIEDSRRYAVSRVRTQAVPGRHPQVELQGPRDGGQARAAPAAERRLSVQPSARDRRSTASAKVRFSLRGASGWVPFGENITPERARLGAAQRLLARGRLRHVQLGRRWRRGRSTTPPAGSWANPYPVNYFASSGVAWAPAVMWMSSLYEAFGRLYYCAASSRRSPPAPPRR